MHSLFAQQTEPRWLEVLSNRSLGPTDSDHLYPGVRHRRDHQDADPPPRTDGDDRTGNEPPFSARSRPSAGTRQSARKPVEEASDSQRRRHFADFRRLHPRPRGPDAQPAKPRSRPAPRSPGRRHRAQRVGQELAGLRHALCRRAAAVYRKPLALRPAVPPSARTARRRSDRGPATDDLHRPAGRQPQSPQHGGHGHRDLRLPAAALSPGWASRAATSAARRSASSRRSRSSRRCSAGPPARG